MKHTARPLLFSIPPLFLSLLLSVAVGSVFIPPATLFHLLGVRLAGGTIPAEWQSFAVIVFDLRLPRTALMLLAGAALGGSGAAFQGLFRNPLADPYLIGVASGAGLGAVLTLTGGLPRSLAGYFTVPVAAFVGALITVAVVYALARVGRTVPTTHLILAGVAVSSFTSALTSFLMLTSTGELRRALVWLLGGASIGGWRPVLGALPYIVLGLGVLCSSGHALNVFQFGEEQARQLGLPVERVRLIIVVAASLATAAAVAYAGIIGFVGLIVPHLMRFFFGADYRRVIPLSVLGGATLLLLADVLARVVMAPQELPVGMITALSGAPFFLWVLQRTRQQVY